MASIFCKLGAAPALGWMARHRIGQTAGGALAGLLASQAETPLVFGDSDPAVKHVNHVLNATTGAAMGMASGDVRSKILAAWAVKTMGLKGVDSFDRVRAQLEPIAKINLDTAKTNKATADLGLADRLGRRWQDRAQMAGDLGIGAAGLLGSGALGMWMYDKIKRNRKKPGAKGNSSIHLKGDQSPKRKRVRIDIPANALPEEFFSSLVNVDDAPKADMTLMNAKTAADRYVLISKMAASAPGMHRAAIGSLLSRLSIGPFPFSNPLRQPAQVSPLRPAPTPPAQEPHVKRT